MLIIEHIRVDAFILINALLLLVYDLIVFFDQSQQLFIRSTLSLLGIFVLMKLYLRNYDRVLYLYCLRSFLDSLSLVELQILLKGKCLL